MQAGIPQEATAWGLRTVALGTQQIVTGDVEIIVAGGPESLSMAPHCAHLRSGTKVADMKMIDPMTRDGMTDAFHGYHMGITTENIVRQHQLSREEQDQFALASPNKAEAAQKALRFTDEIDPFQDPQGRCRSRPAGIYPPWRETIDMGRLDIPKEATELLRERLFTKVSIDKDTARRLLTLIYVLLAGNAEHRILSRSTAIRSLPLSNGGRPPNSP